MRAPLPVRLDADDCIAAISVRYFANGALQTSGNVGDKKQALAMLAAAMDAIRNQPDSPLLVNVAPRDVVIPQNDPGMPLIPRGDLLKVR